MANYSAPGIYVEEVPPGASPIAGVGTSTAAFIGHIPDSGVTMPFKPNSSTERYALAAAHDPQLLTSWGDFVRKFGEAQAANLTLANAVRGFFANGGSRVWVARVASALADNAAQALEQLEAIDEVAILAVPLPAELDANIRKDIYTLVIAHCSKLQDRFAVLDGLPNPATLTPGAIYEAANTDYAAVYFPWLLIPGSDTPVPPCGHVAGLYARVDGSRGVHKAPANERLQDVSDLTRRISRAQQEGLNPDGINIIRAFGNDIKVWGARTVGGDANGAFKYIGTRRLFNYLRESIEEGTRWTVFEPNTPALWSKITRNLNAFLNTVWETGALFGNTPEEAFYVKCNAETNPPEVRALGRVVAEIGVCVTQPAEFVVFRLSQWTDGGH